MNSTRKTKKRRKEFSKVMVSVATVFVIFVLVTAFIIMWHAETADGIEFIVVGAFAFLTLTYRQYYVKAEQENQIKLQQRYGGDYIAPTDVLARKDD